MNRYVSRGLAGVGCLLLASPLLVVVAYLVGEIQTFRHAGGTAGGPGLWANPIALALFCFSMAALLFPIGMLLFNYLAKRGQLRVGRFWPVLVVQAGLLCVCFPTGTAVGVASIVYLVRHKNLLVNGLPVPPPLPTART